LVCGCLFFFFQAEDGIRDFHVTGVQTCALPISVQYSVNVWFARMAVMLDAPTIDAYLAARGKEDATRAPETKMIETLRWLGLDKIGRASCREGVWMAVGGALVGDTGKARRRRAI